MQYLKTICIVQLITIQCAGTQEKTYPNVVCRKNGHTINFVKYVKPRVYAEFGVSVGATAVGVADVLPPNAEMYLFDFHEKVEDVKKKISRKNPQITIHALGNSYKLRDSYNWTLLYLLKKHPTPIFDYVFLDGMHTWETDGFAFILIDLLLKPGGYLDFDDYNWSLSISATLNPKVFPLTGELYTAEQINTKSIKEIITTLVRRNNNYEEVVFANQRNKIFRKKGPNRYYH